MGTELEEVYWKQLDELVEGRVIVSIDELAYHSDAEALLIKLGGKLSKELIDKLPNLKYIGMLGTGYGRIDAQYAASKSITVTNVADYATQAVAEFTFGMILEQIRELPRARNKAIEGSYSEEGFAGTEIGGKKLGVIGLGAIGQRTAEIAKGFGAQVSYWNRSEKNAELVCKGLEQLIKESDIITINLALSADTEGMLNGGRLKLVKKGALVINPSPMELLELDALIDAVSSGQFTFIFDHADEMSESDAKRLVEAGAIAYPPIGYVTEEATQAKQQIFVDNLKNYLAGNPTNQVN